MKSKYLLILAIVILPLFSFTPIKLQANSKILVQQQEITIDAVFDGHEDYGYNFIAKDENGNEHTVTFHKLIDGILSQFDLNAQTFVGTRFKVTYTNKIIVTKNSDGYEDEQEVNTITNLVKL